MVVDGIHDGVDCFISEIGEIEISGITDEQLNVRIETGGTEIFNESYYALKGNVVIHEIGKCSAVTSPCMTRKGCQTM